MAEAKSRRKRKDAVPPALLCSSLLTGALARSDDFIVTCETDPDSGARVLHVMSGRFVSSCMLRKLVGQVESQVDEGSRHVTLPWPVEAGTSMDV